MISDDRLFYDAITRPAVITGRIYTLSVNGQYMVSVQKVAGVKIRFATVRISAPDIYDTGYECMSVSAAYAV